MTTSASGWPKLSHPRFRSVVRLLVLCGGIIAAASRADAQTRSTDPFQSLDASSQPTARHAAPPLEPESPSPASTSPAAGTPSATHRKGWKQVARAHNEEKSHEAHAATTLSPWTAVCALAVVVCLILLLGRVFRKHSPLFGQALPSEALEVLGRRFLDPRQSVLLLRIGSRILVVGSSTAGLQGLGELSDPVEVDLIAGICRGTRNGQGLGNSFLGLLKGHSRMQAATRPRNQPPHRSEPRREERAAAELPLSDGQADPEQELMRRLRGAQTVGPYAEATEASRD
jgi:flagellar biogenesis protein FliO